MSDKQHLILKVTEIIKETADTITIKLVPQNTARVAYRAGQFLTFIIHLRGKEFRRSYSLSSCPETDTELSVTIKRIVNGEISTYLFTHLQPSDLIESLYPAGRFTLDTDATKQRDIFLIAAGSGITPVFSILKSALVKEPLSRITLIYSSKNPANTIFYRQLRELERLFSSQLKCIHLFSEPEGEDFHLRKRLSNVLLQSLIKEHLTYAPDNAEFYLCGPFPFMRISDITIVVMGFDERRIHKENFVILSEQKALDTPPLIEDKSDKHVHIHYKREEYDLLVPYGKTILKAVRDAGRYLPYSCNAGICGTCAAICRTGQVKMSVNEVLTNRDLQHGYILTCTGYAASDNITLDFDMI